MSTGKQATKVSSSKRKKLALNKETLTDLTDRGKRVKGGATRRPLSAADDCTVITCHPRC